MHVEGHSTQSDAETMVMLRITEHSGLVIERGRYTEEEVPGEVIDLLTDARVKTIEIRRLPATYEAALAQRAAEAARAA